MEWRSSGVGPRFVIPSIYGYKCIRNRFVKMWKTCHRISGYFLQCVQCRKRRGRCINWSRVWSKWRRYVLSWLLSTVTMRTRFSWMTPSRSSGRSATDCREPSRWLQANTKLYTSAFSLQCSWVFTTRRYASAVYAVVMCLVCHTPVLYQNG